MLPATRYIPPGLMQPSVQMYWRYSLTLNRVYTEWYRGKGYDFTITSNTAFDQKWVYNATIFENVSQGRR